MVVLNLGIAASSNRGNRELAKKFVYSLPKETRLFLGGYWGLMKDVADFSDERGFQTIFILPEGSEDHVPRRDNFILVNSGMEPRARSVTLCKSSDILVALGGDSGTIIEIFMAYALKKPVIVLKGYGYHSDNLEKAFPTYLDSREITPVTYVNSPEEAAKEVMRYWEKRTKTY
ncbi:hypothetical protein HS7_02750 [Sulfolobales archaeon HS-7]|nr:hypothetical protein HS7_02750 [Sulfolobales archaeon HS-7]